MHSLRRVQLGSSGMFSVALLAGLLGAGCGSSQPDSTIVGGELGQGQAGFQLFTPGGDAGNGSGNGGSSPGIGYSTTLPAGFTAADTFGGYRLGDPIATGDGAGGSAGSSTTTDGCGTTILAVIRDFQADHMNFEGNTGDDRGLVKPDLGPDRKPILASSNPTRTVEDPAQFDSWYRNVDGLNLPFKFEIWFGPSQGKSSFQSTSFFPLDGAGFGNQGNNHNFHFTTEIHTQFKYGGKENFNFTGDDDVWVFINNKLVIDLGGVHVAEDASVDIDSRAAELGLVIGNVYPFDMFQNERHTSQSNFRADTTLNFVSCGVIVPEIPK
ncbi:MAG: fibro-slime domain-containing protein [Polyangiaceae bacterium]